MTNRILITLIAALAVLASCSESDSGEAVAGRVNSVTESSAEQTVPDPEAEPSEGAVDDGVSTVDPGSREGSADDALSSLAGPVPVPPASISRLHEGSGFPVGLSGIVGVAVADLAERLGVDESAIAVFSVEEVVWPNRAMGCEQPGMKYAQVPTDGLRIVLVHAGADYVYHSGGTLGPFLCMPNLVKEPTLPQIDITDPGTTGTVTTVPGAGTGETAPSEEPGGPGDPDV